MPFRSSTLALLLCSALSAAAAEAPKPAEPDQALMDRTFQRLGEQFIADGRTDGMSIAVVKDGKAHFYNFGTTNRGKERPPTEDSV